MTRPHDAWRIHPVDSLPQASDAELLKRFAQNSSEEAFAVLMRRHGPLVMGVCRRLLGSTPDAEDAFQATFLLLVQKCDSIERPEQLAGWLYGVAYRVAARARQRLGMQPSGVGGDDGADGSQQLAIVSADEVVGEVEWREIRRVLDEEINLLPSRLRLPLVLCYLEGMTHQEAARQLGWPRGTMSRRLTGARDALRGRLTRRGLVLSVAALTGFLSRCADAAPISSTLIDYVTRAAVLAGSGRAPMAEVASPAVIEQAEGLGRMLGSNLKSLATVASLLLLLLLGAAVGGQLLADAPPPPNVDDEPPPAHCDIGVLSFERQLGISTVEP